MILQILRSLLGAEVLGIQMDSDKNFLPDLETSRVEVGDKLTIWLNSSRSLRIWTDEMAHFWGEVDIELEVVNSVQLEKPIRKVLIEDVYIWKFRPKGLLPRKYLVQIELICSGGIIISCGVFQILNSKETKFIGTGDIVANFNVRMSGDNSNFECEKINLI
jgi:hypothetical protein